LRRQVYAIKLLFIVCLASFMVQVDHEKRDGLEHKIERELVTGALKDVVILDSDNTVNPVLFQNELRSRVTSSNLNDANI